MWNSYEQVTCLYLNLIGRTTMSSISWCCVTGNTIYSSGDPLSNHQLMPEKGWAIYRRGWPNHSISLCFFIFNYFKLLLAFGCKFEEVTEKRCDRYKINHLHIPLCLQLCSRILCLLRNALHIGDENQELGDLQSVCFQVPGMWPPWTPRTFSPLRLIRKPYIPDSSSGVVCQRSSS